MSGVDRRPPSPVLRAALREQEAQAAGEARVLPFKRGASAPRRRRASPWRTLLGPAALALASVGAPLAVVLWVLVSPRFQLREVEVTEGRLVGAAWVRSRLAPFLGDNLPSLALDQVESALAAHPWVDSVELRKQLPDRLRVRVNEHRPAALLRDASGLRYVDATGRAFAAFDPERAREMGPLVVIGAAGDRPAPPPETVAAALAVAASLESAGIAWLAEPSQVEVLGAEDFRVHTAGAGFPVLVRPRTLEDGIARLRRVEAEVASRYPALESIDLRLDRRLVLRPAAGAGFTSVSAGQPAS